MKRYRSMFVFCFVLVLSAALTFAADNKMPETKKSVTIDQTLKVGNTQLQPKTYTLRWDNSGTDTQVHFFDGRKEVVTVPAKIVKQKNENDSSFSFTNRGSTPQLDHVFFKDETLDFSNGAGSTSGS
jgi:hypothetical protein